MGNKMSSNIETDDNLETQIKPHGVIVTDKKKIPVYSIISYPKEYDSFDLLRGSILEEVEGNRLRIRKGESSTDFYIHEAFDAIYLSRKPTEPNEEVWNLGKPEKKELNPLEELLGKEITLVEKNFFNVEDRVRDLPIEVKIGVEGLPHYYQVTGDDKLIFVSKKPSIRYMFNRVSEIVKKPVDDWTEKEIQELKEIGKAMPFPMFDEDKLKKKYPDLHSKLYGKN